jgi:hypothetical protein
LEAAANLAEEVMYKKAHEQAVADFDLVQDAMGFGFEHDTDGGQSKDELLVEESDWAQNDVQ